MTGYASSDGDEAFNRRLSQKRADAVIQYLAENYSIPLRRFVVPMGYGEKNPVADNSTSAGRKENRRVEVRILSQQGNGIQRKSALRSGGENCRELRLWKPGRISYEYSKPHGSAHASSA